MNVGDIVKGKFEDNPYLIVIDVNKDFAHVIGKSIKMFTPIIDLEPTEMNVVALLDKLQNEDYCEVMNRLDIEQCNDINALKDLAIRQYKALSYISETLVDESKWHITSDKGIEDIRAYLQKHNLELNS